MPRKLFVSTIIALVALEMISWLAYLSDTTRLIAFIVVVSIVAIASLYRLEYGIYALFAELAIGSQGYILYFNVGDQKISLRLALFLVIFIVWLIAVIRQKRIYFLQSLYWKWHIALWGAIVLGVIIGYFLHNDPKNIFFDVNGYLFLGLILPLTQAIRERKQIISILTILAAGVTVLAIKTLFLVFVFSHLYTFLFYIEPIYRWIRDFRLGEITRQETGFTRVFFQSHIEVLYLLFIALSGLVLQKIRGWYWFVGICLTLLLLSYSRSFWLATIVTLLLFAIYLYHTKIYTVIQIIKLYVTLLGVFIVGYLAILTAVNIPVGEQDNGLDLSASSLLSDRVEDAASGVATGSRLALLRPLLQKNLQFPIFGHGFGTTVTYQTKDQRYIEMNGNANYTTFAFEWGYLDLWLKLGLVGLIIYLGWLVLLVQRGYQLSKASHNSTERFILIGSLFGVVTLIVIHTLTPYLNHPLGISWILLFNRILDVYGKR